MALSSSLLESTIGVRFLALLAGREVGASEGTPSLGRIECELSCAVGVDRLTATNGFEDVLLGGVLGHGGGVGLEVSG